jgi:hypothetical protein
LPYKKLAARAPQTAIATRRSDRRSAPDVRNTGKRTSPKLNGLRAKRTSLQVPAKKYRHEKLGQPVNAGGSATKLLMMLKGAIFSINSMTSGIRKYRMHTSLG